MATINGAPETPAERLFDLPQPVAVGEVSLICTVMDGQGLPFRITLGELQSDGRTPEAALLGLPPAVRRIVNTTF